MVSSAHDDDIIIVELVYAERLYCWARHYTLPRGSTIKNLIDTSTLIKDNPQLKNQHWKIGIYGKHRDLSTVLKSNDRVEIYRPITCDPKQVRRQRQKVPGVQVRVENS